MIRSCLSYNAEIWGDAANTYLRKLESIEQLAIAAALGVNRTSNRRELNLEAKILLLKRRWKRKAIRTYSKLIDTDTSEYMQKNKKKRLNEKSRSCFAQRAENIITELELKIKDFQKYNEKEIDKIITKKWEHYIIEERNSIKYPKIDTCKFNQIHNKGFISSKLHQAKLRVLPTNHFLKRIGKSETDKCIFDNYIETKEHFISECEAYDKIWEDYYPERNNRTHSTKELLDTKEEINKIKITEALYNSLKQR